MFNNIKQIAKKIKEYKEIVIARHIGPDPDALASEIALRDSIKLTYPKKNVYAVGNSVSKFKYFGELDRIDDNKLNKPLLIVLDVPNKSRIDGINYNNYDCVIRIDHHPSVEDIANIELVNEHASSTCELITELIYSSKLKINKDIASNLFLGIVADSDRFLLSYTTPKTFKLVTKLIEDYKLDIGSLYKNLYIRPINEVKFQSYIALNMTITENNFGYIKLNKKIIDEFNVDSSAASNMVNNFNFIKELYCWAFSSYDEKNNVHKINIRSRGPIVNDVAQKYNGGGHIFASGARIQNEEDVDNLFKELDQRTKEYKDNNYF